MTGFRKFAAGVVVFCVLAIASTVAWADIFNWKLHAFKGSWNCIASSSDGTKIVAATNYIYRSTDSGATWAQVQVADAGSQQWVSIASSADGTRLAAVVNSGYIYTSTDSGTTWTQRTVAGSLGWMSIGSSSDGTKLVAVTGNETESGGYIYTSTDSGATWTQQSKAGNLLWVAVASSADGSKLVAVDNGDTGSGIYISTDSGATWIEQTLPGQTQGAGYSWAAVASSADGTHLAAADAGGSSEGGYIYTSTDSGATWIQQTSAGSRVWQAVAISGNGTAVIAADNYGTGDGGYIYTSADSGATWTEQTAAGSRYWYGVSSSSDGTKFAACDNDEGDGDGSIYISSDSGATWNSSTGPGSGAWTAVASSSDGTKLIAAEGNDQTGAGGSLYTSTDSGATWTEQTGAGTRYWAAVASSSDGTKLAAVDGSGSGNGGYIYTSVDSGATWTEQTNSGAHSWISVASSADGTKLIAADSPEGIVGGYIYTSTDSGATWTGQTGPGTVKWYSVASSSDGSKLVAGDQAGFVYTSSNSGANWTVSVDAKGNASPVGSGSMSVAVSSDGNKIVAGDSGGGFISTSTNFGTSWTENKPSKTHTWQAVASSADGSKLAAADSYSGQVFVSTNSGVTWSPEVASLFNSWTALASSSNGNQLVAAAENGLYTAYLSQSPPSGNLITVTSPVGGNSWTAGSKQTISWSYSGSPGSKVGIVLLRAGSAYATIASGVSIGKSGTGSYAWILPTTLASDTTYQVQVTCTTNSSYTGTSGYFSIAGPTITLTAPTGGATWTAGGKQTISWSYTGSPGNVLIQLYKGGTLSSTIKSGTSAGSNGSGSYTWTIPNAQVTGSDYQITVTAIASSSCSSTSSDFNIAGPTITLTSPTGGATWTAGGKQTISWSYTGNPGKVQILLYKGGTLSSTIKSSTSAGSNGAGSYTWTIPNAQATGNDYQVTVTAIASSSCSSTSNTFNIAGPTIAVTSPGGGVTWTAGGKQTISWSYTGNPGNVQILLYKGGTLSSTIKSSTSAGSSGNGSYTWTLPNALATGSDYQITATAIANSACSNTSNSFSIAGPTITVTSPGSGATWTAGTKQTISWSYTGNPGNVLIQLYKSGSLNITIKSSTSAGSSGAGSYTWTVPKTQVSGSDYQVQVTATASSSCSGTSASFTIGNVQAAAGPDQQARAAVAVSLNGLNSTGLAGGVASYHWTQTDGPAVALSDPNAAETIFLAPESDADGKSLRFQLTVTNSQGGESEDSCIVNVSESDTAPVAEAGPNQAVRAAQIVELDGSQSSASDSIVSYNWRQISGIPVVLTDASAALTTFVAPDAVAGGEALVFELTVTDQAGLRSRDTCIVNVLSNENPPTAHAGTNRTVFAGSGVLLDGSGSTDPGEGIVSYGWRQVSGKPVVLSAPTGEKTTFIAPDVESLEEELVFELTVADATGLEDKSKVVITVAPHSAGR